MDAYRSMVFDAVARNEAQDTRPCGPSQEKETCVWIRKPGKDHYVLGLMIHT